MRISGFRLCYRVLLLCLLWSCRVARAYDLPQGTNLWTSWHNDFANSQESLSSPALAPDGTIYVGTFAGTLDAFAPDGKLKWAFDTRSEIRSSPAIADDGTIYFGSRNRQFYAVTPDGKLKWQFATGAWVDSSPGIAADGTIYFGSWDKNFYALNPDGSLKWKYAVGGIVDSSPAIATDGTIYFGSHNKKLYALDATGQPRWTFRTQAEITSSPALGSDGNVYFSSTDGNLYRLRADGTEVWQNRIGGGGDGSPVLADNGNIIIASAYNTLFVSPTGTNIWAWGHPCWTDATAAAAQGTICASAPWRTLQGLQPDGNFVWGVPTMWNLTSSPVIGSHGEIYYCCGRFLQASLAPVALLPAKSPWPMFRADPRHTGRVRQLN